LRPAKARGFTMVEMATVIAIIVVVTVLSWDLMRRGRPRADFDSTTNEIQSLVHQARQEALAYGRQVAVMVFPDYANGKSTGRIIVLRDDSDQNFLNNASTTLTFGQYDPSVLQAPTNGVDSGEVISTFDLPSNVLVGPATGYGQALFFPYASITVTADCSFCIGGGDRRGAIVFDGGGQTSFWYLAGTTITEQDPSTTTGGSFSIYSTDLPIGTTYTTSTFVITSPQGSVRTFHNG